MIAGTNQRNLILSAMIPKNGWRIEPVPLCTSAMSPISALLSPYLDFRIGRSAVRTPMNRSLVKWPSMKPLRCAISEYGQHWNLSGKMAGCPIRPAYTHRYLLPTGVPHAGCIKKRGRGTPRAG